MTYPYIKDRNMYRAVMFACKMIRDDGYFNKAVDIASNYYSVDHEELKKHIRERQSAGQKGKKRGTYKNYRFKGKYGIFYKEYFDEPDTPFDLTIKALNIENAKKQLDKKLGRGLEDDPDYSLMINFEIEGKIV